MEINGDNKEEVIIPILDNDGNKIPGLRLQKRFEKAIVQRTVPKVLIADGTEMKFPCYILDYNDVTETTVFEQEAIRSLLEPDTDEVQVYIRLHDKLYKVGASTSQKLNSVIDIYKNYSADERCRVYRCDSSEKKEEIKRRDITKIRLSL